MDDLKQLDLYDLFGIPSTATTKEVSLYSNKCKPALVMKKFKF